MFRTMADRTTRVFAAGALILSLTATTFAGSANAAPLADDKTDCSTAAHARNDAAQLLHTAWKAFDGDLKDLARDARKLQHETEKESGVLTTDARAVVASAKAELKGIDRKSTRLNSSHLVISYAVFCLIKKQHYLLDGRRLAHPGSEGTALLVDGRDGRPHGSRCPGTRCAQSATLARPIFVPRRRDAQP